MVSYNFSKSENFQGFAPHAEELIQNLSLINKLNQEKSLSKNGKFLSISWGDDLNKLDNRELLIKNGFHGIIYDRIKEPKTPKPNELQVPQNL